MSNEENRALKAHEEYRTAVETAAEYIENFDILETITNVGNDEVFTPRKTCDMILDSLPDEVWHNPNYRWLNPATKNGIFEREIAIRLDKGLQDIIPDVETRRKHILQNMIFAFGQTKFTANVARRTLYYCAKANQKCDGIRAKDGHYVNGYAIGNGSWFDDEEGNIKTPITLHEYVSASGARMPLNCSGKDRKKYKCKYCGISADSIYNNDKQREQYAYEFIHIHRLPLLRVLQDRFFKGDRSMKFDIIIGNPPYQLSDGGGANGKSSSPIYQLFIEQAIALNPKYLTMIVPSRWFAGGKGLDDFRKRFLNDKRIVRLDDFLNSKDCFPNVDISGGVCYFLWSSDESKEKCMVYTHKNGEVTKCERALNEFDIFVRDNVAVDIINKIKKTNTKTFEEMVSARCPFGIGSDFRGENEKKDGLDIIVNTSGGLSYISSKDVISGHNYLGKYKIMMSKATSEHANIPDKDGKYKIISTVKIIGKNEICSDSYLLVGNYESLVEAENVLSYIRTKFFRYLLQQSLTSISISKEKFSFIPMVDFNKSWSDKELYELFDLSEDEINVIESTIKPMLDYAKFVEE